MQTQIISLFLRIVNILTQIFLDIFTRAVLKERFSLEFKKFYQKLQASAKCSSFVQFEFLHVEIP